MKRMILILIFLLLFSGCTQEVPEYSLNTAPTSEITEATETTEITEETESTPVETEKPYREYTTYPIERPFDHVIGNAYYYPNAKIIYYYDVELQRRVVLCSQPNCTHNSKECTAYLGGSRETEYMVVGDMAYALINNIDSSGKIEFIAQNIVTGERRILWDLSPEHPDMIRESFAFSVDGDKAFLSFEQYEIEWKENGRYSKRNKAQYGYEVDLNTGARELLLKGDVPSHDYMMYNGDRLVVGSCTESYLLIYAMDEVKELPMNEDEYWKEHPNGDYSDYISEFQFPSGAFYSVNRETGERKRICGSHREAKINDSSAFRGKKFSFADGDTICIYDGHTGEVTRYITRENIAMQSYMDGRIIYNVRFGDDVHEYLFYWYDISTGEEQQFQVGTTDSMIFSLYEETADYFQGFCKGRNCFISKQDWYNENYDAAF